MLIDAIKFLENLDSKLTQLYNVLCWVVTLLDTKDHMTVMWIRCKLVTWLLSPVAPKYITPIVLIFSAPLNLGLINTCRGGGGGGEEDAEGGKEGEEEEEEEEEDEEEKKEIESSSSDIAYFYFCSQNQNQSL